MEHSGSNLNRNQMPAAIEPARRYCAGFGFPPLIREGARWAVTVPEVFSTSLLLLSFQLLNIHCDGHSFSTSPFFLHFPLLSLSSSPLLHSFLHCLSRLLTTPIRWRAAAREATGRRTTRLSRAPASAPDFQNQTWLTPNNQSSRH